MKPWTWHDGGEAPSGPAGACVLDVRVRYGGRECGFLRVASWDGARWTEEDGEPPARDAECEVRVSRWARIPPDGDPLDASEAAARRAFAVWRLGTLAGVCQGTDDDVLSKYGRQLRAQSAWGLEEALYHIAVIREASRLLHMDDGPWLMLERRIGMELEGRAHGCGW